MGLKLMESGQKNKVEATLFLVEADDCRLAEFSCEVIYKDGLGKERALLATASRPGHENCIPLVCESKTDKPHTSEGETIIYDTSARGSALQLSSIIQQSQMSLTSLVQRMQDRVDDRFNYLDKKVSDLEKKESTRDKQNTNDCVRDDCKTHEINSISNTIESLNKDTKLVNKSYGCDFQTNSSNLSPQDENATENKTNVNTLTTCSRPNGPSMSPLREVVINPGGHETPYLCDLDGGWTIIQRRSTGNVDFYRDWVDYKKGFGSLDDEFWLGNERIHEITSRSPHALMIKLKYRGKFSYALYDSFYIASEEENFKLKIGSYSGTAGDSLAYHNNRNFTTYDRDNDDYQTNCAHQFTGAWWYGGCHNANLNGEWGALGGKGPRWIGLSDANPVTFSEMKIRVKFE